MLKCEITKYETKLTFWFDADDDSGDKSSLKDKLIQFKEKNKLYLIPQILKDYIKQYKENL